MQIPRNWTLVMMLLVLEKEVRACKHYKATFPFDPTKPFEASISDNKVTTCWISTTYTDHRALHISVKQQKSKPNPNHKSENKKRSNGHHVSLTEKPMLGFGKDGEEPEKVKGLNMLDEEELQGRYRVFGTRKGSEIPKDEKEAGFLNWEFECLQGFKSHAYVGARTVTYIAHGQEFCFIPKEMEDVQNEMWIYDLKLWCGKPWKNVLIAP